jgi:hypothetical protein
MLIGKATQSLHHPRFGVTSYMVFLNQYVAALDTF